MVDLNAARAKVAKRLRTNFFDAEAKRAPGFRDQLAKQVERVIKIAEIAEGEPLGYDDLNTVNADGVILQGLIALGLVDDETAARWHQRMARFMEAMAAAMPDDPTAKVGDVLTENFVALMWDATAREAA
jgi:hypothetical protein